MFPDLAIGPKRIIVNRGSILTDSIAHFKQRNFDFNAPVMVTFEGEPAIDGGSPKREYFTLLLRELLSALSELVCFFCLADRLSDLLMFATGCSTIPPAGFSDPSVITVLQNDSKYPNANTCPLELELPGYASTRRS